MISAKIGARHSLEIGARHQKNHNMKHIAIEQVLERAERAKTESDYTYFFALLFAGEALAKTIVLGMVASIADDNQRNRYRLEHQLVRSDGLGDWSKVIEDTLIGPASQFLLNEAREEQRELTQAFKEGEWQYDATAALKAALQHLGIEAEEVPVKSDMKRWFRLFATLRNKTRAHGATQPEKAAMGSKPSGEDSTQGLSKMGFCGGPEGDLFRGGSRRLLEGRRLPGGRAPGRYGKQ